MHWTTPWVWGIEYGPSWNCVQNSEPAKQIISDGMMKEVGTWFPGRVSETEVRTMNRIGDVFVASLEQATRSNLRFAFWVVHFGN